MHELCSRLLEEPHAATDRAGTGGLVTVMRRRLPTPFRAARPYVSSEGGLRYLPAFHGRRRPGFDAACRRTGPPRRRGLGSGANVGLFSFAAAVASWPDRMCLAVDLMLCSSGCFGDRQLLTTDTPGSRSCPSLSPIRSESARFPYRAERNRSTGYVPALVPPRQAVSRATELVPTVTVRRLTERFPTRSVSSRSRRRSCGVENADRRRMRPPRTSDYDLCRGRRQQCEDCNRNALATSTATLYDGADQTTASRVPTLWHQRDLAIGRTRAMNPTRADHFLWTVTTRRRKTAIMVLLLTTEHQPP